MHTVRDFVASSQAAWNVANGAPNGLDPALLAVIGSLLDPGHADTVVTGAGISSLADALGGAAATQGTDANRPPLVTTSNGIKVAQFVNDRLSYAASAANNQLVTWGWFGFVLLDNTAAVKTLLRYGITNTNVAQPTDSHRLSILSNESLQLLVHTDASGGQIRSATSPADILNAVGYQFVTVEFNGGLAAETNKVAITSEGVDLALVFADSTGTPGAMPAALQGQPGGHNIAIGDMRVDATLSPMIGKIGIQGYLKAAMPGVTKGLLTAAARTALANFLRPLV